MERKNAWKGYTKKEVKELNKLNKEYRTFLDEGKTERECVKQAVLMAEGAGYKNLADIVESGKTLKAGDKESLWESEEVYQFLVCAVCPVNGDYEPGKPECGFLFPAFKDRSSDTDRINIFAADGKFGNASGVGEVLYFQK